ncbi:hypothetical protein [Vulcanisaeta distributa]|uniref:hypothetical protein n=1 Tax=Vulcanisaeta distributa TaxID=164451 RepID=UPI000AC9A50C|nr:hypothetical protein [Vulcanisaeta distributa]
MVSTIIYPIIFVIAIIGFYLHYRSDMVLEVDRVLVAPFIVVVAFFPTVLLPAFMNSPPQVRLVIAVLLLVIYLLYIYVMRVRQGLAIEDYEGLYMLRIIRTSRPGEQLLLTTQLAISIALLFVGSRVMVEGIIDLSRSLMLNVMGLSIIIVPTATVLPETITAAIWTLRGARYNGYCRINWREGSLLNRVPSHSLDRH